MNQEHEISVLLVDDHHMVRKGLVFFLSTQPGITVAGEAACGADAIQMVEELSPDVVFVDLVLPDMSGIDVMYAIQEMHPHVDMVVLSSYIDDEKVRDAIQAGAAGYLMKDVNPDELAEAIHAIRGGGIYLHHEAARRLAEALRPDPSEGLEPTPDILTDREREVLELVARGLRNQDISTQLNISLKTVKAHVSSILRKLVLDNRVQAALYALRHRIVQLEER